MESPQSTLLAAFQVTSDGAEPTQTTGNCSERAGDGMYVCNASFVFEEAPKTVHVRCDYPAVTVPNHVHILRSGEGDLSRQTMFDIASQEAEIRFVEPTSLEVFWTQFNAGLRRVLINPVLVLFLLALTLSARTRSEAFAITEAFIAVEVVAALVFKTGAWTAPARFVEAAGALTIAYLAVEILLLPEAGKRWLIAGGLGLFHGLFFGVFYSKQSCGRSTFYRESYSAKSSLWRCSARSGGKHAADAANNSPHYCCYSWGWDGFSCACRADRLLRLTGGKRHRILIPRPFALELITVESSGHFERRVIAGLGGVKASLNGKLVAFQRADELASVRIDGDFFALLADLPNGASNASLGIPNHVHLPLMSAAASGDSVIEIRTKTAMKTRCVTISSE